MSTIRRRRRNEGQSPSQPGSPAVLQTPTTQSPGGFTDLGNTPAGSPTTHRRGGMPVLAGPGEHGHHEHDRATSPGPADSPAAAYGGDIAPTKAAPTKGVSMEGIEATEDHQIKVTPRYLLKLYVVIPLIFLVSAIALIVMLGLQVSTYIQTQGETRALEFLARLSETSTNLALEHYKHAHLYDAKTKASVLAALNALKEDAEQVVSGTATLNTVIAVANDAATTQMTQVVAALTTAFGPILMQSSSTPKLISYFQLAMSWTYTTQQHQVSATLQKAYTEWDKKTIASVDGGLTSLESLHDNILMDFVPSQYIPEHINEIHQLILTLEGRLHLKEILPNRSFVADKETKKSLDALADMLVHQRKILTDGAKLATQQSVLIELSLAIFVLLIGFAVSLVLIRDQHQFLSRRVVLQQDFKTLPQGEVQVNPRTLGTLDAMCRRLGVMSRTIPRSQNPNQAELHLQCGVVPLQRLRPFVPPYAFENSQEVEVLVGDDAEEYVSESVPTLNLNQGLKRSLTTCLMFLDFSILNVVNPQRRAIKIEAQQKKAALENKDADDRPAAATRAEATALTAGIGPVNLAFKNLIAHVGEDTLGGDLPPGYSSAMGTSATLPGSAGANVVVAGAGDKAEDDLEDEDEVFGPDDFTTIFVVAHKVAAHFHGKVLQVSPKGILFGFERAQVQGLSGQKKTEAEPALDLGPNSGEVTPAGGRSPAQTPVPSEMESKEAEEEDEEAEAENLAVHTAIGIQEILREQISSKFVAPISIVSGTAVEGLLNTHLSKFYTCIGPLVTDLCALQRLSAKHDTAIMLDSRTAAVIGNKVFLTRPVDFTLTESYIAAKAAGTSLAQAAATKNNVGKEKGPGGDAAAGATGGKNDKNKGEAGKEEGRTDDGPVIVTIPEDATTLVYQVVLERPHAGVPDRERVVAEQQALEDQLTQWEVTFQVYMNARRHSSLELVEEAYKALEAYRNLFLVVEKTGDQSTNPLASMDRSVRQLRGPSYRKDKPFDHAFGWVRKTMNDLGMAVLDDD